MSINLNKATLQLMSEMQEGLIYRTDGGRDVRRQKAFNNPVGHKAQALCDAGLAELRPDAKWRLTPLGEQAKAKAEAEYDEKSVNSRALVVASGGTLPSPPAPVVVGHRYQSGPGRRCAVPTCGQNPQAKVHWASQRDRDTGPGGFAAAS
jgi:hypothetical protein